MCDNLFDNDMVITNNKAYCNTCENATCNVVKASNGSRYNWYCEVGRSIRMLDISCPQNTKIDIPEWCPLKKATTTKTSSGFLGKLKPMVEWDAIKVNQIYRIPPYPGETRRDILIKSKTNACITYIELEEGKNNNANPIKYLYPTSSLAKVIVPHRNLIMEVTRGY